MKNLSKMTPAEVEVEFKVELMKLLKRWGASIHAVEGESDYGICAMVGAFEVPLGWSFNQNGEK